MAVMISDQTRQEDFLGNPLEVQGLPRKITSPPFTWSRFAW